MYRITYNTLKCYLYGGNVTYGGNHYFSVVTFPISLDVHSMKHYMCNCIFPGNSQSPGEIKNLFLNSLPQCTTIHTQFSLQWAQEKKRLMCHKIMFMHHAYSLLSI